MLALDFENGGRRAGVGTGLLEGNAVSEECDRVAALIDPTFGINAIVDDYGRATQVFAGHWREAHREACDSYLSEHSIRIAREAGTSDRQLWRISLRHQSNSGAQSARHGGQRL